METHNVVFIIFVYIATNWSWFIKEGQTIATGCPASIFGNLFGLVEVHVAILEKISNNFDGLSVEKDSFLVEMILCLELRLSVKMWYKDNKLTIVKILLLAWT